MWKAIIYKEWIKIRWTAAIFLGLGILVLINILLRIRHDILFVDATNYWYNVLFRGYNYASMLKFLPFLAGLGISAAQYFPETVNRRIKLTFHLPVKESRVLMGMHLFGTGSLLLIYAVWLILFVIISAIYFPPEIMQSTLITIIPWFMGGLATYFMAALILLEPVWLFRVLYALVAYGFITMFYQRAGLAAYLPALPELAVLTVLSSIVVLFSGYRFRKGEM
ncbi:MAG TPA: hypothetical protein ENF21_10360 [Bacteroidetes bacterium]|nr:hypothetical protein [Bacteroidota bacterium]